MEKLNSVAFLHGIFSCRVATYPLSTRAASGPSLVVVFEVTLQHNVCCHAAGCGDTRRDTSPPWEDSLSRNSRTSSRCSPSGFLRGVAGRSD